MKKNVLAVVFRMVSVFTLVSFMVACEAGSEHGMNDNPEPKPDPETTTVTAEDNILTHAMVGDIELGYTEVGDTLRSAFNLDYTVNNVYSRSLSFDEKLHMNVEVELTSDIMFSETAFLTETAMPSINFKRTTATNKNDASLIWRDYFEGTFSIDGSDFVVLIDNETGDKIVDGDQSNLIAGNQSVYNGQMSLVMSNQKVTLRDLSNTKVKDGKTYCYTEITVPAVLKRIDYKYADGKVISSVTTKTRSVANYNIAVGEAIEVDSVSRATYLANVLMAGNNPSTRAASTSLLDASDRVDTVKVIVPRYVNTNATEPVTIDKLEEKVKNETWTVSRETDGVVTESHDIAVSAKFAAYSIKKVSSFDVINNVTLGANSTTGSTNRTSGTRTITKYTGIQNLVWSNTDIVLNINWTNEKVSGMLQADLTITNPSVGAMVSENTNYTFNGETGTLRVHNVNAIANYYNGASWTISGTQAFFVANQAPIVDEIIDVREIANGYEDARLADSTVVLTVTYEVVKSISGTENVVFKSDRVNFGAKAKGARSVQNNNNFAYANNNATANPAAHKFNLANGNVSATFEGWCNTQTKTFFEGTSFVRTKTFVVPTFTHAYNGYTSNGTSQTYVDGVDYDRSSFTVNNMVNFAGLSFNSSADINIDVEYVDPIWGKLLRVQVTLTPCKETAGKMWNTVVAVYTNGVQVKHEKDNFVQTNFMASELGETFFANMKNTNNDISSTCNHTTGKFPAIVTSYAKYWAYTGYVVDGGAPCESTHFFSTYGTNSYKVSSNVTTANGVTKVAFGGKVVSFQSGR